MGYHYFNKELIDDLVVDVSKPEGEARLAGIVRMALEHQVAPPSFMAGVVARQLRALPAQPPAGRQLLAALERRAIAFEQLAIAESEHDDARAELAILAGQNADRAASRWSRQLDAAACGRTLF